MTRSKSNEVTNSLFILYMVLFWRTREHVLDHFRISTTTLFQLKSMSITFGFKSQFSSEPVFVMCMYFSNTECFLLHFVLIYHPKVSEIFKILIRINKWRHLNRYFKAWDNDNKNSDDILRVATFVILLILINVMQSMFLWGYKTLIIVLNMHSYIYSHQ